jgi:uncharacterized protein (DUF2147 family)
MNSWLRKLILLGVLMDVTITIVTIETKSVRAAELTAAGLWEQVDEKTGKAESWFRIAERNGLYEGTIVKIFGEDSNWTCDKCEGADRGKPVLGLTLIKGMHRNGNNYEDGSIMDPRDGTVYRALMRLSPDGQKLEMRGYVGFSLLGRSQIWNRLPDNALGPTSTSSRPPARGQKK